MKSVASFFLLTLLITSAVSAKAEEETVRLCSSGAWAPFAQIGESFSEHGIYTQKTIRVFEQLPERLELHKIPWKRCLKMIEAGEMDGSYAASFNEERASFAHFTTFPLGRVGHVPVIRKGTEHGWDDSKDLGALPQPIGSPLGYWITGEISKQDKARIVSKSYNDEQNLRLLLEGRLGSILIPRETILKHQKLLGIEQDLEILSPAYSEENNVYIIISKKYRNGGKEAQELVGRIDEAIHIMASQ
ncbi:transporter substrate-binding domain-containing protein [Kiloniella sp. b19]|uniref:transporter substrate-binding domain-containing protein n=1 Tax=Kiloniella sp. GXU_MW_B19 TaxID=3141326 RepID=UPI0031D71262